MSPAIAVEESQDLSINPKNPLSPNLIRKPLKSTGSLSDYSHFTATPTIGTEFPSAQLTEILKDEAKIRDLAILGMRESQHVTR